MPVRERNRWDKEGILPDGESSSTRSTRCIGIKRDAAASGSPLINMFVASSKDASSIPHKLSPAGSSANTLPQNFSRGLLSVTSTTAPDWNGPAVRLGVKLLVSATFFEGLPTLFLFTLGLSPARPAIATAGTGVAGPSSYCEIARCGIYRGENARARYELAASGLIKCRR
jgi:hypothetical protein